MEIEYDEVKDGEVRATVTMKRTPGEAVRTYGVIAKDKETSAEQLLAFMRKDGLSPEDFE